MTTQTQQERVSTNERVAGEIAILIGVEFVLSLLMLRLEYDIAANPGGPFGKGHFYEPMFIAWLSFFSLLARFACTVLWCWWSSRIRSALQRSGLPRMRGAPWAAGWWFVPGFNFVMPYLGIRALWNAAVTFDRRIDVGSSARVPVFVAVWWGFWTIHLLAYILVLWPWFVASFPDSTVLVFMVRDAALLVAAPLAIAVVVKLNRLVPDIEPTEP